MLYALINDQKVQPFPKARGICPQCGGIVQAKCGSINAWHWAHDIDCDPWTEPETEWHKRWKTQFLESQVEVVMGNHRADIVTRTGYIIELQHSSINAETIQERELFYGERMIWVIDGSPFFNQFNPSTTSNIFRWRFPRKSWWFSKRPVFIDRSGSLFHITEFFRKSQSIPIINTNRMTKVHGRGFAISTDEFIQKYND